MKYIKFLFVGILFGIVMSKAEIISWYRIYEMFKFQSFHMYGIIGSAVFVSLIFNQWIKRSKMKDIDGVLIDIPTFYSGVKRYLLGGIIFGFGWALSGACPGPLYTLVGNGATVMIISIISAMLGALLYGMMHKKLPH